MSNLSGQPVPQSDLPDAMSGTPVPQSDLPQGAGSAAGGPPPQKTSPDPVSSNYPEDAEFAGLARSAIRGGLEGASGIFTFVPDLAQAGARKLGILPESVPSLGEISQKYIDKALRPGDNGFDKATEFGASLLAGGVGGRNIERGAEAVGVKAKPVVKEVGSYITKERAQLAKEAHALGAKISPGYIGGAIAKGMRSLGGEPRVDEQNSVHNEEVADRLIKSTLGLKPEDGLNEQTFDRLKNEAYQAYRAIGQNLGIIQHDQQYFDDVRRAGERNETSIGAGMTQGEPYGNGEQLQRFEHERARYMKPRESGVTAQEMLDKIRSLRYQARTNLKAYQPDNNMLGRAQWDIANAMENQIQRTAEKIAQETGDPNIAQLVPDMKAARQQLARINAVQLAMGAGGHVRSVDLAKMLDNGVPLDGGLKKVAELAAEFPKDWAPASERGEHGLFSAVDFLLGGSGIIFHHPMEAGLPFIRIGARKALKSEGVQSAMVKGAERRAGKVASPSRKAATAAGAAAGGAQNLEDDDGQQD